MYASFIKSNKSVARDVLKHDVWISTYLGARMMVEGARTWAEAV
jgi:hypothetical protein